MAELLVFAYDNSHPDPDVDQRGSYKSGNVVVKFDDGHQWGSAEVEPLDGANIGGDGFSPNAVRAWLVDPQGNSAAANDGAPIGRVERATLEAFVESNPGYRLVVQPTGGKFYRLRVTDKTVAELDAAVEASVGEAGWNLISPDVGMVVPEPGEDPVEQVTRRRRFKIPPELMPANAQSDALNTGLVESDWATVKTITLDTRTDQPIP